MSFRGEITLDPSVKITHFRAAGLSVKVRAFVKHRLSTKRRFQDCIVFTITPTVVSSKIPFADVRLVIPIRLTTDPWTADGRGIAAAGDTVSRSSLE